MSSNDGAPRSACGDGAATVEPDPHPVPGTRPHVEDGAVPAPRVSDAEWRLVRAEFGQRQMGTLRRLVHEYGGQVSGFATRLAAAFDASVRIEDVDRAVDDLVELLVPIWEDVAPRPDACVLLAAFGYARCQLAWELTASDRIVVGIRALRTSWERARGSVDREAALAVDLLLHHTGTLLSCLRAENALKCSCPVELETEAGAVAAESAELLGRSAELGGKWSGFRDGFLVPLLRSHELTYGALREVARAVGAWAQHGRQAAPALQGAMEVLERAERDPCVATDVYASELRGHRAGLRALLARIADTGVPELCVDEGKVVYCYPFAIPDADGARVCHRAERRAGRRLGPDRVLGIAETELSDLWNAQGRQEAQYSGITITLPELTVRTTSGDLLPGHAVSVRLSRLGNHYVRIERSIGAVTLHDLNQAMRRVSSYMGLEEITEQGGAAGPWRRLPDYVRDLVDDLAAAVGDGAGAAELWSSAVDTDCHVLLEVTAASVVDEPGAHPAARPVTRPATRDDVLAAVGPVVRAPLQGLPSALEEWARFAGPEGRVDGAPQGRPGRPGPPEPLVNLVGSAAFPGDFVGQTYGATLVVMLDTPHWAVLGYEEQAEFVASLSPLLEGWRKELVLATEQDHGKLDLFGSEELSRRRLAAQEKVTTIQSRIALLHSLDLWKTLREHRFAENLYSAAGLRDVEAELARTIERVDLYYERLAALIARKEERRNRRYQTVVELILAVLAVSSLAEVFGLANDLFGLEGAGTAGWEIGLLAGAAVLVTLVVLVIYKLRD